MTLSLAILIVSCTGFVQCVEPLQPNQPKPPVPPEPPSIDQVIISAGGGPEAFKGKLMIGDERLVELDMRLTQNQFDTLYPEGDARIQKRKAHWDLIKRWTNATVPYLYHPTDEFTDAHKGEINKAIDEITAKTCVRFVAATDKHANKVKIQNGTGCNSHLGMAGGEQVLNLHQNCRIKPTVLHELGHVLGLVHEHQLPDRDEYLNILYQNVAPDWVIWFNRLPTGSVNQYGVKYDYRSIMHYGITAFTSNGKQTIQAKDITKGHLIQDTWAKSSFSFSDIKVINLHYECNAHCSDAVKNKCPQPDSFLNKNCKCEYAYGRETDPLTGVELEPAGQTTVVPCIDRNVYCKDLAAGGACNTDPSYMLNNCQVSCGVCSLTSSSSPTLPTTTGAMPCFDFESRCYFWASQGHCNNEYESYMLVNCKKSCNVCQTTLSTTPEPTTTTQPTTVVPIRPSCADSEQSCPGWAAQSFCDSNDYGPFMRANCQESCGLCDGSTTTSTTTTTPAPTTTTSTTTTASATTGCRDNEESCIGWAELSYCTSAVYEGFMKVHCKKSCGLCCKDESDNCAAWEAGGYCTGQWEPYMTANCKFSCKLCPT